ncbi:MAG: Polyhydroxyalkanoic acid synthase, partial [uncultured Rubrobacteraceae bacterium]
GGRRLTPRGPGSYGQACPRSRALAGRRPGADGQDAEGGRLDQEQGQALPIRAEPGEEASRADPDGLRAHQQAVHPGPHARQQPHRVSRGRGLRRVPARLGRPRRRRRRPLLRGIRARLPRAGGEAGVVDVAGGGLHPLRLLHGRNDGGHPRRPVPRRPPEEPGAAHRAGGLLTREYRAARAVGGRRAPGGGESRRVLRDRAGRDHRHRPADAQARPELRRQPGEHVGEDLPRQADGEVARHEQVGQRRHPDHGCCVRALDRRLLPGQQARPRRAGSRGQEGRPVEDRDAAAVDSGEEGPHLRGAAGGGGDGPGRERGQGVLRPRRRPRGSDDGEGRQEGPVAQGLFLALRTLRDGPRRVEGPAETFL